MKENQLVSIIRAVLSAIILAAPLFAADFEITKVIEVSPADSVPFMWPVKWSPDGTMISYFSKGYTMISDTLENTYQVRKVESLPRVYEWASDIVDFDSPRRTVEGNLCFRTYTKSGRAKYLTYKSSKKRSVTSVKASDHYPRWGTDALCLVRVDGADSIKIRA